MQIDPAKVTYLAEASRFLGNVAEENILQIGAGLAPFRQDFRVINRFQHLKTLDG
jgi:hypothetical protein